LDQLSHRVHSRFEVKVAELVIPPGTQLTTIILPHTRSGIKDSGSQELARRPRGLGVAYAILVLHVEDGARERKGDEEVRKLPTSLSREDERS